MNLCIISNVRGYSWAGSENLWHLTAMRALAEGHSVTAFLHPDLMPSDQVFAFRRAGGVVHNWKPFQIARFQSLKEKYAPSFSAALLNRFDSILVSLGSLPSLNYVPGLASGLLKTTSPIHLLCQFNSDHLIISPGERNIVRTVMEVSAACFFVSQRNLTEARCQFSMEPPNAHVVMNPVRNVCENPSPWPDPEIFSFASVARFEVSWKGQDLLLEVLEQPLWRERNWRLRFYGEGPDLQHLRRLTDFYGLGDHVSFEGFLKDPSIIWDHNHLLLMPSRGEGMPLAALEAMMAGRPVVATDVGGNAEIIQEGTTGFLAEAATFTCFSKAMERAWDARPKWRDMGQAAHLAIQQRARIDPAKELLRVLKVTTMESA